VAALYKSLSHTDWCSPSRSSLRCLVAASNSAASSISVSSVSYPRWLATFSCSSRAELTGFQLPNSPTQIYSLCSLSTDRIQNTSPNSSSTVASRSYSTDRVENTASQLLHCYVLRICCLATSVFAESFSSNGCLCWLHSSCLEQICHNIV
jgi:hypothetical protein